MPKEEWKENPIDKIFRNAGLWPWKDGEIVSILDVGCGLALKSKFIPAQIRVGVDIYEEYFEHIESDVPYIPIKWDVRKLSEIFLDKSFDLVIALDVIEHLEKGDALSFLRQCERIATKAVIVETCRGFVSQNLDILGYGGHEYQTHRSGWEPYEFVALGYRYFLRDYKMSDTKRHTEVQLENPNIQQIDAIKVLSS